MTVITEINLLAARQIQNLTRIFDELCCMNREQISCNHGFERIE